MIKIGIIGPESTGKTALAQALAKHYRSPWEPEYARGYLEKIRTSGSQMLALVNDILDVSRLEEGDAYLLCTPDLPWEPDPLRENGDRREYFFDWYKRELEELQAPYGIVSGTGEARLQCAISLLDNFKKPRRKKTK